MRSGLVLDFAQAVLDDRRRWAKPEIRHMMPDPRADACHQPERLSIYPLHLRVEVGK